MSFSQIYRDNVWNGVETRSGPGSGAAATERIRLAILDLVDRLRITSVVDAACGEGFWQPELPGYIGLDVADEAIEVASHNHPERDYRVHDIRLSCPKADLVLCRDAIQHLSFADGIRALDSIKASGSEWLLASTYVDGPNRQDVGGQYVYHEPNLEAPPYNLPPALLLIRDGYDYTQPDQIRDWRKMLGLWHMGLSR